jgi:hypothetical protein
MNLVGKFENEDDTSGDKSSLNFENLKAPMSEEWRKVEVNAMAFTPPVVQRHLLAQHVLAQMAKLEKACEVVAVLVEVSESRFEFVDDQVVHLGGSIRLRPRELSINVLGFDLWTNMAKLADDVVDAQEQLVNPIPSRYDVPTRSLMDTAHKVIRKNTLSIVSLEKAKAEYVGQVKPLEVALEDGVVADLYEPEGSYNRVLMDGFSGKAGGDTAGAHVQAQYKELAKQVKQLSGKGMGSRRVGVNDPLITPLRFDVARLLVDSQMIQGESGRGIVKINNETFHSADEIKE